MSASQTLTVTPDMTAESIRSGAARVFSTPSMIALMECAAVAAVEPCLEAGWISVGTALNVEHLAPTPIGLAVTAIARLLSADGRRLRFAVEARCGDEIIGRGTHERVVVHHERFMARAGEKLRHQPERP
ncbi:MAG: thioesterase family protein [Clostridiales bacterium]|nr:thioesterase family protein [Clostridiales bacterium]